MPQSLSKVIASTSSLEHKNRSSLGSIQTCARAYMHTLATICRDLGAELVRVGDVADHVHIVTTLPRTVSQAQLVEQIK